MIKLNAFYSSYHSVRFKNSQQPPKEYPSIQINKASETTGVSLRPFTYHFKATFVNVK